jgi:hypothetical protein
MIISAPIFLVYEIWTLSILCVRFVWIPSHKSEIMPIYTIFKIVLSARTSTTSTPQNKAFVCMFSHHHHAPGTSTYQRDNDNV